MYRLLLHLYPAAWRAEYGEEMCAVFQRRLRSAAGFMRLFVWIEAIADLLTSAFTVQFDLLRQDIRYAFRAFRKSPGFAITAVTIGALGIGATTAAFTMVDYSLIRPLPFPHQERLVRLYEAQKDCRKCDVAPGVFREWKRASTSFDAMGAFAGRSTNLTGHGEPRTIDGAAVTADVLPMLGAQPLLGRLFTAHDDSDAAPATIVLSYSLWQNVFGSDPGILGRAIDLYDTPYIVIGVMPRDFYFPNREAQYWMAMRWRPDDYEDLTNTYTFGVARLREGVSLAQATAEMNTIAGRLAAQHPRELRKTGATTVLMRDDIGDDTKLMLKVLLGAAGCVLLIACTNLANLLLARAMVRRRELAVRTALGAGRERLVRQTLTESLMLALGGGAAGLVLAKIALPLLTKLVPVVLPVAEVPPVDGRVLAFAAVLTLVTGVVFGMIPALRVCRHNHTLELHEGGRGGVGGRREKLRSTLVIAEVAMSVVLLVGFGLLARALWRINGVDPGFRPDHVLTLRTALPMPRYKKTETREPFYRRVLEEVRNLPGVSGAAYISFLPMTGFGGYWPVGIEGHPEELSQRRVASLRFVTPGYFAAMGIPLLEGRDVSERDTNEATYVAIVSQSFVRRYWRDESPLGRRIDFGNHKRTIIGVAGDIRLRGLDRNSEPQVYVSWKQPDNVAPWYAPKDLVIRTAGDPVQMAGALRRIIHAADPNQPIIDVRLLEDIVQAGTLTRRLQLNVLGSFAIIAFLLAAVGIHGLLSFAVSSRTQEIGVRIALGARRGNVLAMTLGDGFRLTLIGAVIGCGLAYPAGRILESMLAGVRPDDLMAFGGAVGLTLVMTLAGSALPAMRAMRIDPTVAIRTE